MTDLNAANNRLPNETADRLKAEEELKQHTKLLSTLLDVSNLVSSSMELRPLLEAILDRLKTILDYNGARFFIVSEETVEMFAHRPYLDDEGRDSKIPLASRPMLRQIIRDKKPMVIGEIHADDPLAASFRTALDRYMEVFKDSHSWMGLPMIVKDRVVGVLTLDHHQMNYYSHKDIEIGMAFANQAAIEIENAKLYNENARLYREERERHLEDQQRRYVAEGLRDMLAILNSRKSLDEILNYIVKEAARLVGTDTGALFRLNADKNELLMEAASRLPDEFIQQTSVPVGHGAVGKAVLSRTPVVITDVPAFISESAEQSGNSRQREWLLEKCDGIMALPIVCKEEIYGSIALYFKKSSDTAPKAREFKKEMLNLTMTFADQAALVIDNARLRVQAAEMAVAAERNRLARDLHDAVTQTLFSASLIAEVLPRLWERNPDDGRGRLEELRQLTRGALAEMRTLLFELRPATLVEAALEDLLRQLSEAITGRARIPVALKIEGRGKLSTEVKIALYRIAQEALNNIAKHSGASSAEVLLQYAEEDGGRGIRLKISDNGKGFEPHKVTSEHLGVGIMRERAETIGAELRVESRLGSGTDIILYCGNCAE